MTPSAAAVATAASTALPPCLRTLMPAAEASGSTLETAPPWPTATGPFEPDPPASFPVPIPAGAKVTPSAPMAAVAVIRASNLAERRLVMRRMKTS